MTTDPFAEAARAEAERRLSYHDRQWGDIMRPMLHMAEWARTYLAAQELTDAELDALHDAFVAHSGPGREINEFNESCCTECGYAVGWPERPLDGGRRAKRHAARAALSAARAARRDEEKR